MRWQKDQSRRGAVKPGPGGVGHLPCPACQRRLDAHLPLQLIAVGPDIDSLANLEDYAAGKWCRVQAAVLHADCAAHLDDHELEMLVHRLEVLEDD